MVKGHGKKIPKKFYVILIILQILVIFKNLIHPEYNSFLWFCDFVPILILIGLYLNYNQFLKALINIGLISHILIVIDLIVLLIFNYSLSGIAESVLRTGKLDIFVFILLHSFTIIPLLYFNYKIEPKQRCVLYSFIFILILHIITINFARLELNVNSSFNCPSFVCSILPLPFYKWFYPFYFLLILIIPTYIIQLLIYYISKHGFKKLITYIPKGDFLIH